MTVKRIVAFIIDSIVIYIITGILFQVDPTVGSLIGIALIIGYQVVFLTAMGGKTPGKMVMGLKVVSNDGGPVSPVQAALRGVGYVINSIICYIGWILVVLGIFSIHDTIAGTRVVEG